MKAIISILALQLCMTAFVTGQMPGMASHSSQSPDDSNAPTPGTNSNVTFTKDVAPILQNHCQVCHPLPHLVLHRFGIEMARYQTGKNVDRSIQHTDPGRQEMQTSPPPRLIQVQRNW